MSQTKEDPESNGGGYFQARPVRTPDTVVTRGELPSGTPVTTTTNTNTTTTASRPHGPPTSASSRWRRPPLANGDLTQLTGRTNKTYRSRRTLSPTPERRNQENSFYSETPDGRPVWTDEGYFDENPWYGRNDRKPIFSLGRPLPHKVRRRRVVRRPQRTAVKKDEETGDIEEVIEEEVLNEEEIPDNDQSRQMSASNRMPRLFTQGSTNTTRGEQEQQFRATANGVSHGNKRNDAGQPVFDYMPGETDDQSESQVDDTLRRRQTSTTSRSNKPGDFKIDGEPLGHSEQPEVESGEVDPNELRNWWARVRARHPEPLAEFLATSVAVFLGLTATLSVNLSSSQPDRYGDYETSCWAWGFAWMFGIYLAGGVSGAHMNPAISISLSLFRGFPWRSCFVYITAQFLGSLAAGGLAYGLFADSIHHVDPNLTNMSKTFFSTPKEWVSFRSAFANQVVGSAVQMMAVLALGDDQNNPPGAGMHAFVIGLLVTTTKWTLGYNIGSALNPASDFGPRVVAYAAGYREPAVFHSMWWLYGPWLGTVLGTIVGSIVYDSFVFVGSESPVNYRMGELIKEKRAYFSSQRISNLFGRNKK